MKFLGHDHPPKSSAPGVTLRKKRIAEICVLFHGSTLSYLENTSSKKKNVSETSVLTNKGSHTIEKNLISSICVKGVWIGNNLMCMSPVEGDLYVGS